MQECVGEDLALEKGLYAKRRSVNIRLERRKNGVQVEKDVWGWQVRRIPGRHRIEEGNAVMPEIRGRL